MLSLDEPIGILGLAGLITFGIALVFSGILIVLKYVKDTELALMWIARLIISLGAGFISFGLLGSIEIESDIANIVVKAGGPIAFTIAVFFAPPGSWDRNH